MLDAKEGFEQLAVWEGGLKCDRSGITDAPCPEEHPSLGDHGELAVWAAHCPSAPGRQAGRQEDRDFIGLLQYLGIQGNSVKQMKWSPSELPAVFFCIVAAK